LGIVFIGGAMLGGPDAHDLWLLSQMAWVWALRDRGSCLICIRSFSRGMCLRIPLCPCILDTRNILWRRSSYRYHRRGVGLLLGKWMDLGMTRCRLEGIQTRYSCTHKPDLNSGPGIRRRCCSPCICSIRFRIHSYPRPPEDRWGRICNRLRFGMI
jgi:hypothetical protein